MESKRMTIMFITMMIVIGNFVVYTEAQAQANPFRSCFPGCISNISSPPLQMILANKKIDHNDYFCKLGCATHHCLVLSSPQNSSKFYLFIYF
ncbi:hypothetical protein F2Q69_00030985 [Brassica cretica]|uniref:Thionin-like protein n=1 Tax=Brassica cretica TaxID=69181 RepID=A0A8S9S3B3_BRACR|nr:hypothetical protein F2Q69_00030985 [Brassica cretica]